MSREEKKEFNFWNALLLFLLQTIDSALLPWALAEIFVLGLAWILTRNLSSKDTLSLLNKGFSLQGFAWAGWIIAMLEIPFFRWTKRQSSVNKDARIERLEEENIKARKMLSKEKQGQLGLDNK